MENQINNQQGEKAISTTVGVIILILVAIIISLVVWKFKGDAERDSDIRVVPVFRESGQKEAPVATEAPVGDSTAVVQGGQSGATDPGVSTKIDFDKELKDLDTASGAVDYNDFGDSGLSNANLGL